MKLLEERILKDGNVLGENILKVDVPSEEKWQNSWASPAMMQRSFRKW